MIDEAPVAINDRYELRGLIGQGGMAEVHRGFDRTLRREVAVKIMHSALGGQVDRQRFASEAQLLASLNDPHLVTLLDAGVDESEDLACSWLVMELVKGPTLAQRLKGGPLTHGDAATVGAGIAQGLAHVHSLGVVHRDVKPANVLLTLTGTAKLADFGVARMMGDDHDLTQTGHTIGTAAYLAPEQVKGQPVTGASDVYALGLVLLEVLTGRRAYTGPPAEAALARLHRSPIVPVSLGARWTRLLTQMTAADPAARPTATDIAVRLSTLTTSSGPAPLPLDALDETGDVVGTPTGLVLVADLLDRSPTGTTPGWSSDTGSTSGVRP